MLMLKMERHRTQSKEEETKPAAPVVSESERRKSKVTEKEESCKRGRNREGL
ncbi:uncharacterized protein G2W53_042427 [Senna tora]|uniref:Uncharacterized protein n=1 Tax=Senna tora TaxID=362788 RepID=A0A834W2E0_9FABA|nr:uncharacterized protein G2W53_042427 [Senna tora]